MLEQLGKDGHRAAMRVLPGEADEEAVPESLCHLLPLPLLSEGWGLVIDG